MLVFLSHLFPNLHHGNPGNGGSWHAGGKHCHRKESLRGLFPQEGPGALPPSAGSRRKVLGLWVGFSAATWDCADWPILGWLPRGTNGCWNLLARTNILAQDCGQSEGREAFCQNGLPRKIPFGNFSAWRGHSFQGQKDSTAKCLKKTCGRKADCHWCLGLSPSHKEKGIFTL